MFVCTHLCFALKNMQSSVEASRRVSATCQTDGHLMLPKVLSSTLNLTLFSFSKNKALGGGKRKQRQGPVWLIPGSDMWGSSCGKRRVLVGD